MIIDTVTLQDFGVFRGTQTICLTPDDGRPIVLIGGLNGCGKTTVLDAIQLALFGRHARLSNRRDSYNDYLARYIHGGPTPGASAGVGVVFRVQVAGVSETIAVRRAWVVTDTAVRETLVVVRNPGADGAGEPDTALVETWDDYVQSILPVSVAPLFFFDGERIETLADADHSADVLATAVTSLLGLDIVDQLVADLMILERRKRAENVGSDDGTAEKIASIETHLADLTGVRDELSQRIDAVGATLLDATTRRDHAERTFIRQGGGAFATHSALVERRSELAGQIADLEERLRHLASGAAPLLLVPTAVARIVEQDAREVAIERAGVVRGILEERDAEIVRRVGAVGVDDLVVDAVASVMAEDRHARASCLDADVFLHLGSVGRARLAMLVASATSIEREIAESVREVEKLRGDLIEVERSLEAVPSEDAIAESRAALVYANDAVESLTTEIGGLRDELDGVVGQIARCESDLQRLVETEARDALARDDVSRIIRHSTRTRETAGTFRTKLIARHIRRIEESMLESLDRLMRKDRLVSDIRIDPETFEIEIVGRDGQAVAANQLSAGERQILAVSMLWGLACASGRPLPVVVDTPLGRLDSRHRALLVERYFPNASHQVIILSTDEEIDERTRVGIEPFVARSYILEHDDTTGSTTCRDGYFWKE